MTIKELETTLDMTRANIRFYEQEGFLTPERGSNNYRVYSQDDVETLKKIKLLRQLGLPLDTIRQVQRGEQALDAALAQRQRTLEEARSELEWAGRVCASMRSDGAEYDTLDAGKYLSALDRPAEGEGYFSLSRDSVSTVSFPWRRFFARWLDLCLYSFLWLAFGLLVLRFQAPDSLLFTLLGSYLNYGTMLVVEPLLLSTWGYTPGKWIFGLQVRSADGSRISWGEAMARTWLVFAKGEGFGIPFYKLYRNYKSYQVCADYEVLPWEEEYGYTIRDAKVWRCLVFTGAVAALLGLTVLTGLQAQMPRHRGILTPEQYADNVNDLYHFLNQDAGLVMDENGHWEKVGNVIHLFGGRPDHQLTLDEAGRVTAVTIVEERAGEQLIFNTGLSDKQLAACSFAAAVGDYNCISWVSSGVMEAISAHYFDSYTLQAGDVTITQKVTYTGYQQDSNGVLFADESIPKDELYYYMEFTLCLQT